MEDEMVEEASPLEVEGEVEVEEVDTSNEALDKAAEETVELEEDLIEEVAEIEEELEEVDEPVDNAARTKLGRKVKAMDVKMDDISTKLSLLLSNQIDTLEGKQGEAEVEDDFDYDEPITPKDLKRLLPKMVEEMEQKKNNKKASYEKEFLSALISQGSELEESVHDEITQIMLEKYNKIITGDPKVDAELAFLKAERDYSVANVGGKKVLRGQKAPVVDKPGGQKKVAKAVKIKKLDKAAQEFVDRMGLSTEFVQNALGK